MPIWNWEDDNSASAIFVCEDCGEEKTIKTDNADIIALAKYIAGKPVTVNEAAVDVNGNGSTGYDDLIDLINLVNGSTTADVAAELIEIDPYAAVIVLQETVGLR